MIEYRGRKEVRHLWGKLSTYNKTKLGSFACCYEQCCLCGKIRLRKEF